MRSSEYFASLSAGTFHTCGITTSQRTLCWGQNASSQLGRGSSAAQSLVPEAVAADPQFVRVSAGGEHTCALSADGTPWCWGANATGQLGVDTITVSTRPTPVSGVSALTNVEAGEYYTCGLDPSGMLICWGDNFFGQLGDGTRIASRTATIGAGGRKYAAFDVAFSASCGIAQDGQARCWGSNGGGQLGDGTERSSQVPVKVRF